MKWDFKTVERAVLNVIIAIPLQFLLQKEQSIGAATGGCFRVSHEPSARSVETFSKGNDSETITALLS